MKPSLVRKPARPVRWLCAVPILLIALVTISVPSQATKEPAYQTVRDLAGIEVRQYAPYTVAEVTVYGPADDAGKQAFPILAGYIFGKNKGDRKLALVAVELRRTPGEVAGRSARCRSSMDR